MKKFIPLQKIARKDKPRVGGKAYSLARLIGEGVQVPEGICLPVEFYNRYVSETGIRGKIFLELGRKDFEDMRWEEIWDAALRIRNMFLTTPIPEKLRNEIAGIVKEAFPDKPVVVRSSAPDEDASATTFAGLHESVVNVRGVDSILSAIKKVWSSLWSDGALLYRKELGLDVLSSSMAVVIQKIVVGECSGVVFGRDPVQGDRMIIESVYGLNQGLVDGAVEPDRWRLHPEKGKIISHDAPEKRRCMLARKVGLSLEDVPEENSEKPPLSKKNLKQIYHVSRKVESVFGSPQDMEWTMKDGEIYILQSRPITTGDSEKGDKRPWYLSLRRSFENLERLREKIEGTLIPQMISEADDLKTVSLEDLSDVELADEIEKRIAVNSRWMDIYWEEFIPYAHGVRLFGQVYNDRMKPDNPYEFLDLLGSGDMEALRRNDAILRMAAMVRNDKKLEQGLQEKGIHGATPEFEMSLHEFIRGFEDNTFGEVILLSDQNTLIRFILEAAKKKDAFQKKSSERDEKIRVFLDHFSGEERKRMEKILDLARSSYTLRDNDNIYLGRITGQMTASVNEGISRLKKAGRSVFPQTPKEEVPVMLRNPQYVPGKMAGVTEEKEATESRARQIRGQPAGPGVARGSARVIRSPRDLFLFKSGEILVCDAIDPNMTFAVPLAGGIVERRGGMLIHGAIIAREYGIACVTGVPGAVEKISTGDTITVDGYIGLVTISRD